MVDPATGIAILTSTLKLLESGLKLTIWDGWATYPSRDRLEWLSKLLGMSADTIGKAGEAFKHISPEKAKTEQALQLWAVHVASFGEALAHHWGGSVEMAGRPGRWSKWFLPQKLRMRESEVRAASQFALDLLTRSSREPLPRDSWWTTPTASPYYRALWEAFTRHEAADGTEPLLLFERDGDVQRFEGHFSTAFREALARAGNAELRVLLDSQPRSDGLRQLIVTQMSAWRHHHVFASIDTTEGIPELPLELSYVEPTAWLKDGKQEKKQGPILTLLADLLREHRVIFVSADFGMGKSLTARTLAWRWAATYVDPRDETPTIDRIFPIYVRCNNISLRGGLDDVFRRALKRSADAAGVSVRLDDAALAPPSGDQRAVVLLDGLDEMIMSTQQTREFVQELEHYTTDKQRVIVFSRPEALPRQSEAGIPAFPRVVVEAFSDDQIEEWLWAWPRSIAPTRVQLKQHGLEKLASVPILLFMLALTWERHAKNEGIIPRVKIYENFFDILAAGKYERGGETHPPIRRAAEQAREALVERKELPPYKSEEEGHRRAVDAIRWLMERVAWEALRREFAGEVLLSRHVSNLLERELRVAETTLEEVRIGLLLGMQAHLGGGDQQFFFGHRSFLEFAVARYWERQLRHLCTEQRNNESLEESLWGAPLLEEGSRVFEFLQEMLTAWTSDEQKRLLNWAHATISDETMAAPPEKRNVTFRSEPRILIRQAALAIGSHTSLLLGESFNFGDGTILLLISTWWIIARKQPCLFEAPGVTFSEGAVYLAGLISGQGNFPAANFSGANLTGWTVYRANFYGATLSRANLSGATLPGANLSRADLSDANLSAAKLFGAKLVGAKLANAKLTDAHLTTAKLSNADLSTANLNGANLLNANLLSANLSGAKLSRTKFSGAKLIKANLSGAKLVRADLSRANLSGANLSGANLHHANLSGANISGANLLGANLLRANLSDIRYDENTRWPTLEVSPANIPSPVYYTSEPNTGDVVDDDDA